MILREPILTKKAKKSEGMKNINCSAKEAKVTSVYAKYEQVFQHQERSIFSSVCLLITETLPRT